MGSVESIILNVAVTIPILASYWIAVTSPKSPIFRLNQAYFSSEGWVNAGEKELDNIRHSSRQISEISAVLAGVALAALAFIIEPHIQVVQLVGGLLMLGSAVLFFWAVALHFANSVASKESGMYSARAAVYKRGFLFTSLGVFMFYNGLVWALSALSDWFPIMSAVGYAIIFLIMLDFRKISS